MTTMIGNDGVATEKEKDKDVLVPVSACMKPDEVQRYIDIAHTRFAKHGLLETAQGSTFVLSSCMVCSNHGGV